MVTVRVNGALRTVDVEADTPVLWMLARRAPTERPLPEEAVTPVDHGARARLEAAFAREERRGLMLAAAARSTAVVIILGWLAVSNPERGPAFAWVLGTASVFLVTGVAQLWVYFRGEAPPIAPYAFMLVDSLALAAVLLFPNPFDTKALPLAMPLRYATFMYFFLLLMQAAFSFRPRLLLWTGLCGAGAWTLGFLWIVTRPETRIDAPSSAGRAAMLTGYFDPNYVSILKYQNEVIVFVLVSAGLALLVRRSRTLVAERAEAERARGNLARYFSPKVVDTLAERDEPLGRVRRQAVGVLFADLVGFTTMAEGMTPEEVMALLRDFHGRMEEVVFATAAAWRSSSATPCWRPSAFPIPAAATPPTPWPAPAACWPPSRPGIASARQPGGRRCAWGWGCTARRRRPGRGGRSWRATIS